MVILYDTNLVGEKKGYKLIAHTPNLIFIKNDEVGKIYDFSYNLVNYSTIIIFKMENIKRSEVLKLFSMGFQSCLTSIIIAPSTKIKIK